MFSFFKNLKSQKTKSMGTIGLSFLADGISVAVVSPADDGEIRLEHCEFHPCGLGSERLDTLKTLKERLRLERYSCRLVLSLTEYKLLQIEAPEVPDEEMKEAISWAIQDMIDFPVDKGIIDYFPLPNFDQPGRGRTITVVVTQREIVDRYAKLCAQAGIALNVIDIQEMALRNLTARMPEDKRGVALVYLQNNEGMVVLAKDALIYVSRKFEVDINMITVASSGTSPTGGDLALEIQRSLDYYERKFAMPPVSGLVVSPLGVDMEGLFNYLNSNLGTTSRVLDVSALLHCGHSVDDTTQSRCLPAIGTALGNYEGQH